jgi:hypothetical protein
MLWYLGVNGVQQRYIFGIEASIRQRIRSIGLLGEGGRWVSYMMLLVLTEAKENKVCFSQSSYESCVYPRSFVTAAGKWGGGRICGIDVRAGCFHLDSFACTQTSTSGRS